MDFHFVNDIDDDDVKDIDALINSMSGWDRPPVPLVERERPVPPHPAGSTKRRIQLSQPPPSSVQSSSTAGVFRQANEDADREAQLKREAIQRAIEMDLMNMRSRDAVSSPSPRPLASPATVLSRSSSRSSRSITSQAPSTKPEPNRKRRQMLTSREVLSQADLSDMTKVLAFFGHIRPPADLNAGVDDVDDDADDDVDDDAGVDDAGVDDADDDVDDDAGVDLYEKLKMSEFANRYNRDGIYKISAVRGEPFYLVSVDFGDLKYDAASNKHERVMPIYTCVAIEDMNGALHSVEGLFLHTQNTRKYLVDGGSMWSKTIQEAGDVKLIDTGGFNLAKGVFLSIYKAIYMKLHGFSDREIDSAVEEHKDLHMYPVDPKQRDVLIRMRAHLDVKDGEGRYPAPKAIRMYDSLTRVKNVDEGDKISKEEKALLKEFIVDDEEEDEEDEEEDVDVGDMTCQVCLKEYHDTAEFFLCGGEVDSGDDKGDNDKCNNIVCLTCFARMTGITDRNYDGKVYCQLCAKDINQRRIGNRIHDGALAIQQGVAREARRDQIKQEIMESMKRGPLNKDDAKKAHGKMLNRVMDMKSVKKHGGVNEMEIVSMEMTDAFIKTRLDHLYERYEELIEDLHDEYVESIEGIDLTSLTLEDVQKKEDDGQALQEAYFKLQLLLADYHAIKHTVIYKLGALRDAPMEDTVRQKEMSRINAMFNEIEANIRTLDRRERALKAYMTAVLALEEKSVKVDEEELDEMEE